ncbi:BMC domain-containing protein [Photobacterium profundum]|jgi:microcompartment protein CcmL/EutN|uniref:Polyhedral body protein n=2 Tax=Photobacterium TaxID=657 RepID=Q1YX57_9GAMM|nr:MULTISPECIES: BMC domain-containing protein [Photobacterium]EAS40825.1 polyhedral body protein [Photobacterium profundum 3TCK]PSV49972.1 BMC domain-containing protein [Photobacterium indicum]PSV62397.1 BMC domain-containing protein [Photobacterium profundum]
MVNAIGCIELNSIARGYLVADAMLKAANVEILFNRTICPGKFMVMVGGDVAAINAAVETGLRVGGGEVVDDLVIANVHPDVFPAIAGTRVVEQTSALGIVETFSVAAIVEAADAAVKAANIELLEVHMAMAIGGKGFVTMTGDVAAVQAAVDAAVERIRTKGVLVDKVVIAQPRKEILEGKV